LSLPERIITAIEQQSHQLLEERLGDNKKQLQRLKFDLEKVEQQLHSIEEKWVNNQFSFDAYQKWNSSLTQEKSLLGAKIESLSKDENRIFYLLKQNLIKLTDMNANYKTLDTLGKQEMIRTVFDSKLYYQEKVYRTPFIMPIFTHNLLILKQKQLLLIDKKGDFENKISLGGAEESRTPVQTQSP
jgi:site-specific DNA recombinase